MAGAADLSKQKSGLEESVLGIANRTSKSDKSTGERVKCNPNSSSSSSSHSAPVEEDGMSLYFKSVISAKSSEIALNERRFEEELRVRSKEEALAERRLALEEKKAQSDADNIALQIIKYNQSQMPK